jgi:hypothetical protein
LTRAATGQRTSAGGFSAGTGFIKTRTRTPKHTAKKKNQRIIKGLPLDQYLADFNI